MIVMSCFYLFFFNDTATTEIYTLSLHDALPISLVVTTHGAMKTCSSSVEYAVMYASAWILVIAPIEVSFSRSEEHTSELQSQSNLVCRLLLEKKKQTVTLIRPLHSSNRLHGYIH